MRRGKDVFDKVYYSDEAWFHLSGHVNFQNNRYWTRENPHGFEETSLHSQKIGVWCGISRKKIIGPIFFDAIVNSQVYQDILMRLIAMLDEDERFIWFQQDGAESGDYPRDCSDHPRNAEKSDCDGHDCAFTFTERTFSHFCEQ